MPRASQTDRAAPQMPAVNNAAIEAAIAENNAPPDPYRWQDMEFAPRNRSIYLTTDPKDDDATVLSFWKTTRVRERGQWKPEQYWARVTDHRKVPFEPVAWREASAGAALKAAHEAQQRQEQLLADMAERQRKVAEMEAPDEPAGESA